MGIDSREIVGFPSVANDGQVPVDKAGKLLLARAIWQLASRCQTKKIIKAIGVKAFYNITLQDTILIVLFFGCCGSVNTSLRFSANPLVPAFNDFFANCLTGCFATDYTDQAWAALRSNQTYWSAASIDPQALAKYLSTTHESVDVMGHVTKEAAETYICSREYCVVGAGAPSVCRRRR